MIGVITKQGMEALLALLQTVLPEPIYTAKQLQTVLLVRLVPFKQYPLLVAVRIAGMAHIKAQVEHQYATLVQQAQVKLLVEQLHATYVRLGHTQVQLPCQHANHVLRIHTQQRLGKQYVLPVLLGQPNQIQGLHLVLLYQCVVQEPIYPVPVAPHARTVLVATIRQALGPVHA